jgi:NCS1 family nucleobase:cation symporter-1
MNWTGVIVYLIGIVVEIPFMSTTMYTGPVAKHLNGTDLSWLVGLVVTIPLYYFAAKAKMARTPQPVPEVGGVDA